VVRSYLSQAKALGARDEDISTAGLSINANTTIRHPRAGASSSATTLPAASRWWCAIWTRSATTCSAPRRRHQQCLQPATGVLQADELQRQALAKAALDAQAKAKVLADTLGVKLGAIHTISASSKPRRRPARSRG